MQSRYDSFSHSFLTNEETNTLATRICTELESAHSTDEFLTEERNAVNTESSTITTLKSRSSASDYTVKIDKKDEKRDTIIRVIERKLSNDVDLAEYDPALAENAKKILKIMENSPVNIRAGYSEESTQINRLLEVVQKPENAPIIEASSVAAQFTALQTTQDEFEDLIQQRAKANSETPVGEVRSHIKAMVFHLEGILSYLERKAISNGATFEASAAKIEDMIMQVMAPARARASKREAELELAE